MEVAVDAGHAGGRWTSGGSAWRVRERCPSRPRRAPGRSARSARCRLWQPKQRSSLTFESTGGCGRGGLPSSSSRDVAGGAARAVAVNAGRRGSRARVPRWQPAQSFRRWLSAGVGSRLREDLRASCASRPAPAISPNANRSTETMPAFARHGRRGDALRSPARGSPRGRRCRATVESAPGSGSMPACARSLPNASAFPRWHDAQPSAARAWAPPGSSSSPHVARDASLDSPAGAIRPWPTARSRRGSRPKAAEEPRSATQEGRDERTSGTSASAASKTRIVKRRRQPPRARAKRGEPSAPPLRVPHEAEEEDGREREKPARRRPQEVERSLKAEELPGAEEVSRRRGRRRPEGKGRSPASAAEPRPRGRWSGSGGGARRARR